MIINWNSTTVGPNEGTYYAFMTVMIAGVFLAGFILSPHRVIKEDGNFILQHILQTDGKSSNSSFVWTETKAIARLFIDPRMILMLVPAASSNFFYTYQFGKRLDCINKV